MSTRLLLPSIDSTGKRVWGTPAASPPPPPPPSPASSTIFGYNTGDPETSIKMQTWKRVPIARCYQGHTPLPSDGSYFRPGGAGYKSAGMGIAGVVSDKRLNLSVMYNAATITSLTSAKVVEIKKFVQSIPDDWYVQIVMEHEYNLPAKRGDGTIDQFVNSFKIIGQAIYEADAGRGVAIAVQNPSFDVAWSDSYAAPASQMPPGSQWHADCYDNPIGIGGYKGYGHPYRTPTSVLGGPYDAVVRMGYNNATYGWGVDEFFSPRRVAPKLATLDPVLGWGPNTPYDIDGSGQAASIKAIIDFAMSRPVPPTTFILFTYNLGTNWNQSFSSGGRHKIIYQSGTKNVVTAHDDYREVFDANGNKTGETYGPHYQGFPFNTDSSLGYAMYQKFIDISA